jgi:hypothetical protein
MAGDFPAGPGSAARDRLIALRAALAGAGIPTAVDPDQVDVGKRGGAWVRALSMEAATIDDTWEVRYEVYLVAPAVGVLEAWDILSALLDRALTVIDPDEPVKTAVSVTLPHTPTQPLPAFLLVVDELVDT